MDIYVRLTNNQSRAKERRMKISKKKNQKRFIATKIAAGW